jgi:YfiH family protein
MTESRFEELELRGGRWVLRWNAGSGLDAGLAGRAVAPPEGAPLPSSGTTARVSQVHGADVALADAPGVHGAADALVTTTPGLTLAIRVADCVPVFLVSPGGLALAHAGWRGSAAGVTARTLARLLEATGDAPGSVRAWIGPAIGACCYEVGDDVADAFPGRYRRVDAGRPRLDLAAVNRDQLLEGGVGRRATEVTAYCTRCHQHLFFSHRGSGGKPGRLDAFLARSG